MKKPTKTFGVTVTVGYRDQAGVIHYDAEPLQNLITDWGMRALDKFYVADMTKIAVGCYLDITNRTNVNVKYEHSSMIFTFSNFDLDANGVTVGDMLKIDEDGAEFRITSINSALSQCVVAYNTHASIVEFVPASILFVQQSTLSVNVDHPLIAFTHILPGIASEQVIVDDRIVITDTRVHVAEVPVDVTIGLLRGIGWGPGAIDPMTGLPFMFGMRSMSRLYTTGQQPVIKVQIKRTIDIAELDIAASDIDPIYHTSKIITPLELVSAADYSYIDANGSSVYPSNTGGLLEPIHSGKLDMQWVDGTINDIITSPSTLTPFEVNSNLDVTSAAKLVMVSAEKGYLFEEDRSLRILTIGDSISSIASAVEAELDFANTAGDITTDDIVALDGGSVLVRTNSVEAPHAGDLYKFYPSYNTAPADSTLLNLSTDQSYEIKSFNGSSFGLLAVDTHAAAWIDEAGTMVLRYDRNNVTSGIYPALDTRTAANFTNTAIGCNSTHIFAFVEAGNDYVIKAYKYVGATGTGDTPAFEYDGTILTNIVADVHHTLVCIEVDSKSLLVDVGTGIVYDVTDVASWDGNIYDPIRSDTHTLFPPETDPAGVSPVCMDGLYYSSVGNFIYDFRRGNMITPGAIADYRQFGGGRTKILGLPVVGEPAVSMDRVAFSNKARVNQQLGLPTTLSAVLQSGYVIATVLRYGEHKTVYYATKNDSPSLIGCWDSSNGSMSVAYVANISAIHKVSDDTWAAIGTDPGGVYNGEITIYTVDSIGPTLNLVDTLTTPIDEKSYFVSRDMLFYIDGAPGLHIKQYIPNVSTYAIPIGNTDAYHPYQGTVATPSFDSTDPDAVLGFERMLFISSTYAYVADPYGIDQAVTIPDLALRDNLSSARSHGEYFSLRDTSGAVYIYMLAVGSVTAMYVTSIFAPTDEYTIHDSILSYVHHGKLMEFSFCVGASHNLDRSVVVGAAKLHDPVDKYRLILVEHNRILLLANRETYPERKQYSVGLNLDSQVDDIPLTRSFVLSNSNSLISKPQCILELTKAELGLDNTDIYLANFTVNIDIGRN